MKPAKNCKKNCKKVHRVQFLGGLMAMVWKPQKRSTFRFECKKDRKKFEPTRFKISIKWPTSDIEQKDGGSRYKETAVASNASYFFVLAMLHKFLAEKWQTRTIARCTECFFPWIWSLTIHIHWFQIRNKVLPIGNFN